MILKGHDSVLQTNGIFFKSQVTPLMILVPVEILNPNAGGLFPDKLLAVTTQMHAGSYTFKTGNNSKPLLVLVTITSYV